MRPLALLACLATLPALPAAAQEACRTANTGAACIIVPQSPERVAARALQPQAILREGDRLDRGRYSILLNAEYYGLPPVSDGWVYMRVERDVYRVDWNSHAVIERVTDRTTANF